MVFFVFEVFIGDAVYLISYLVYCLFFGIFVIVVRRLRGGLVVAFVVVV